MYEQLNELCFFNQSDHVNKLVYFSLVKRWSGDVSQMADLWPLKTTAAAQMNTVSNTSGCTGLDVS